MSIQSTLNWYQITLLTNVSLKCIFHFDFWFYNQRMRLNKILVEQISKIKLKLSGK